ncbi:MAG: cell division protein SepF [Cyanobacteriota bacterium]
MHTPPPPVLVSPGPSHWSGVPQRGQVSGEQAVVVLTPRSMADARQVIQAVRQNRSVVVNSAWLEDAPGQRLIDFICGGMAAIEAQTHRIAEEVFLFAPAGSRVTPNETNNNPSR